MTPLEILNSAHEIGTHSELLNTSQENSIITNVASDMLQSIHLRRASETVSEKGDKAEQSRPNEIDLIR